MIANLPVEAADLKSLRETLCIAQTALSVAYAEKSLPEDFTDAQKVEAFARHLRHVAKLQKLIDEIDVHRPLGSDGKHGRLHTPTCGCEDRRCGQQNTMVDGGAPCVVYGEHSTHTTASGRSWRSR